MSSKKLKKRNHKFNKIFSNIKDKIKVINIIKQQVKIGKKLTNTKITKKERKKLFNERKSLRNQVKEFRKTLKKRSKTYNHK